MTATEIEIPSVLEGLQFRGAELEDIEDNIRERIIVMRAVPYDVETRIGFNLIESFEPGAFSRSVKDPARVKLWHGHSDSGGTLVGQAFKIEDLADGPRVFTRVSKIAKGDELLTLVDDKVLDEASIEFTPIREAMVFERRGDVVHVRHKRSHLKGVGMVPHGAYGRNALVLSTRDEKDEALEAARAAAIAKLTGLTA